MPRKIYDPRLKLDAIHGVVPPEFKEIITPLLIKSWEREKWNNWIGYDYYNDKQSDLWEVNVELQQLKQSVKKLRVEHELLKIMNDAVISSSERTKLAYENRHKIIDCIEKNKKHLKVLKSLNLLGISYNTYYFWKVSERGKCDHTGDALCKKKHPNVLSKEEELKILHLLQDPRYVHYPLTSLIWKAHHENIVHASLPVWKRIRDQYGITRQKPKRKRRSPSYKSLKGKYPNQYLHADITYFKIASKTYYIYIVKDNYSKYIKSWFISDVISSEIRIETFKKALSDVDKSSGAQEVSVITDMGTENKNEKVKKYFENFENINIKYAKLDIPYSNSMVERFNSDLKYMYLYRESIKSLKELNDLTELAVNEHNNVRRLESLNGQTPMEVYFNLPEKTTWIKNEWRKSRITRRERTKKIVCCFSEKNSLRV